MKLKQAQARNWRNVFGKEWLEWCEVEGDGESVWEKEENLIVMSW